MARGVEIDGQQRSSPTANMTMKKFEFTTKGIPTPAIDSSA